MSTVIKYSLNMASATQIAEHLRRCDADFVPRLSGRVEIDDYARKIASKAVRFEGWVGGQLIGLVAAYCNDLVEGIAYITSVSVLREWAGKRIAESLVDQCVQFAQATGMRQIALEVGRSNVPAIKLYQRRGFVVDFAGESFLHMSLKFEGGKTMNSSRDHNAELRDTDTHKYAYCFDLDVMHSFMIRSFEPFFNRGNLLELGSFKGDFTARFLPYFNDITCVEVSDVAVAEAKRKLGEKVHFINSLFETASLPKRYDNIVLTHVLEHLDDPVLVLKRVNCEWLSEKGRFFLVCPNANAPSRQIAVKMGLISHNSAVTQAEAEHGHRRTYSLDTLERDAVAAGLKVVHRSGIFFKALANFQWDRLLQTDIVSKEYLEGCYRLGQQYPELCSSIFLMCERGAAQ